MGPRSQSFFHLTKRRDTLERILSVGGFWPRYCFEQNIWRTYTARSPTHFWLPIVCFCDIPLSRLGVHAATYGNYGLGLSKDWAQRAKLHPVAYVDPYGPLARPFNEARASMSYETWIDATAFIKPLAGEQERCGVSRPTDFYEESEWRHLARSSRIEPRLTLPPHVYADPDYPRAAWLAAENDKTFAHCLLRFEPSDVRYIFVESDADIPVVIRTVLGSPFAQVDPDGTLQLVARIASLQTLITDL